MTKRQDQNLNSSHKTKLLGVFQKSYTNFDNFKSNVLDMIFGNCEHHDCYQDFAQQSEYQNSLKKIGIEHFYAKCEYTIDDIGDKLKVYEVVVSDQIKIHRARVGIQSFLRRSMSVLYAQECALIIFRYENPEDRSWRLSYIAKTGDLEGKVHYTNAKRYTYIFGPGVPARTAAERFESLAGKSIDLDALTAAFSVEAVTKEFYTKLFKWYEWAQLEKFNVTFPNDIATKEDDRDERLLKQHLIRLITRLIFVWFIKQKGLVSDDLFNTKKVKEWMVDFDPMAGCNGGGCTPQTEPTTSYYHGILQNLFFATLNNAMGKAKDENGKVLIDEEGHELDSRRFAYEGPDEAKRSKHYGVKTLYRYASLFTKSGKIALLQQLNRTPFLNGGLFECLDIHHDKASATEHSIIYSDGFSREDAMQGGNFKCRAFIPNVLFFNDDDNQPGLITLLKQYNFTVEENTPDEEQVALDPELLGKIFENLLASYNPETAVTARRSTGSYYTPREIVHYMAEQSIAECLKTKLKEKFCRGKKPLMKPEVLEQAIDELMQGDECPKALELARSDIEDALLSMKILDPACGSGAFPMGVMQVMLDILAKVKGYETFEPKQHEYKLRIIQDCLYGVDIQPIAVQITKLRCFISLVIDEPADLKNPDNLGITVLPNLETKFVCANSLIPLDDAVKTPEVKQKSLIDTWLDKVNKAKNELWDIREKHFAAKSFSDKENLRKADKAKRDELRKLYKEAKVSSEEVEKLLSWDPYDQTISNSFFDPEWMLGVKDGFDVVIGNPPYIDSETMCANDSTTRNICVQVYDAAKGNWDIYIAFFNLGYNLLRNKYILSYITPNKWLSIPYGHALRELCGKDIIAISDYSDVKVFDAGVNPIVTFIQKGASSKTINCTKYKDNYSIEFKFNNLNRSIAIRSDNYSLLFSKHIEILNELTNYETIDDHYSLVSAGATNDAYRLASIIVDNECPQDGDFKIITTGVIRKCRNLWGRKKQKINKTNYSQPCVRGNELKNMHQTRFELAKSQKILVSGRRYLDAFADFKGEYAPYQSVPLILYKDVSLKALLPIINSSVAFFFMYESFSGLALDGGITYTWKNLSYIPFPELSDSDIQHLESYADELIKLDKDFSREDLKKLDEYICSLYFKNTKKLESYTDIIVSFGQDKFRIKE